MYRMEKYGVLPKRPSNVNQLAGVYKKQISSIGTRQAVLRLIWRVACNKVVTNRQAVMPINIAINR